MMPMAAFVAALLLSSTGIAAAAAASNNSKITDLVAFGDSYSDTNNTAALLRLPPDPSSYQGRASNGPVWVEVAATGLNASLHDFAYGGAVANLSDVPAATRQGFQGQIPDFDGQLALFKKSRTNDTTAFPLNTTLFTVFAGGNDYIADLVTATLPDTARVASASVTMVNNLIDLGASTIAVMTMPPLDLSPVLKETLIRNNATSFLPIVASIAPSHNTKLIDGLSRIRQSHPAVRIIVVDLYSFTKNVTNTTTGAGVFANTSDACFRRGDGSIASFNNANATYTVCADPDSYLFWDGIHPTAHAHRLIGGLLVDLVNGGSGEFKADAANSTTSITTAAAGATTTTSGTTTPKSAAAASRSGVSAVGLTFMASFFLVFYHICC